MIELRRITFAYDDRTVLRDVDLSVDEGELVVVSGRTGVGKSTLLGVLTGLVPRFSGGTLAGDVVIDGESVVHRPPRERAHLVGYVGQDPAAGFVTDTVEEELAYGMEQLGLPEATMRRRVEETLDLLGIAELRSRALRSLSGGQQQRVAIVRALAMQPQLMLFDEVTSALDPELVAEVLDVIGELAAGGMTMVIATHEMGFARDIATRVCFLDAGVILEQGPPEQMFGSPRQPRTQQFLQRIVNAHRL
jgi:energy-coupling factor transport system ATP-binding protein